MIKLSSQKLTIASFALAAVLLSACSKMEFAQFSEATQLKTEIPIDYEDPVIPPGVPIVQPLPQPPAGPTTSFKVTSGACAQDSSTQILSCLKCDLPLVQKIPQLSAKGQALLDIMVLACQVPNKSDHNNLRPTREMILKKLNQASPANYPETARTAQTEMLIQGLTNPDDSSLRKKMFGGLWYQPPYSISFETYFGLTVDEAKSTFCWNGDKPTPEITNKVGVYSIEWLQCSYTGYGCTEKPEFVKAQSYRKQLENSLKLGITNPYSAPIPDLEKTCYWDKFEGDDMVAAKQQLKKWKAEGRKVSMSIQKSGGAGLCGDAVESSLSEGSVVELATYKCE